MAAETQQLHNCWQMAVILDFIRLFQQHLNLQVSPAQHGSMPGSLFCVEEDGVCTFLLLNLRSCLSIEMCLQQGFSSKDPAQRQQHPVAEELQEQQAERC